MTSNLEMAIQSTENIVFRSNALTAEGKAALVSLYRLIATDYTEFCRSRNMDIGLRCMLVLMQYLQAAEDETSQLWATAVFKLVYAATTKDTAADSNQLIVLNALLLCCAKPAIVETLVEAALWDQLIEEYGDEAYEHDALEMHVRMATQYGADQMLLASFRDDAALVATNALVKARYETILDNIVHNRYGESGAGPDIRQMTDIGAATHLALANFIENDIEVFGIFPA